MNNQEQSGRSMIEMLGVLGIMGVIMYGAVVGINFGIDIYKVNAVHSEVEELSKAIIDNGLFRQSYDFLENNAGGVWACKNNAFANCDGSVMKNKWAGSVTLVPTEKETVGKKTLYHSFEIRYANVPKVSCKRLIDDMWFENVCISSPKRSSDCGRTNTLVFSADMTACKK